MKSGVGLVRSRTIFIQYSMTTLRAGSFTLLAYDRASMEECEYQWQERPSDWSVRAVSDAEWMRLSAQAAVLIE
jgi:hypothetical protein